MKNKKITLLLLITLMFMFAINIFTGCTSTNFVERFSQNVNTYNIEIEVDEVNHFAKCKQQTEYINKTDTTLNSVYFHLYPNAFDKDVKNKPVSVLYENKAYPNGESYGRVNINQVSLEDKTLEVSIEGEDKTLLKVELGKELFPNESVKLYFDYELELPNINHRFGYGDNTLNFGNFYPIACVFENGDFDKNEYHYNGDPFYSDIANYKVKIKNFEKYVLATTGNIISQSVENNQKTSLVEAKVVRDFAFVLSDKFETKQRLVGNTTINYFYYNDKNPEKSLQTCVDSLNTFNNIIETYPYKTLNVVESNFVHGGMEFPNLVLISDCLEKYEDYQNTIIHEIAHQWWYGVVGNNEYKYGWLDEGLTEFTTALFYENNPNYNLNYQEIMNNANSSYCMFVEVYGDIFGSVDTSMNRALNEFKTEPEYVYIAYVKGTLLFDNLREILGDKTFFKCLKKYYSVQKGKNATPQDLIAIFENTSLVNLEGLFNSWIEGKVVILPKQIKSE